MELPNIAAYAYQDVHVWSALLTCLRPKKTKKKVDPSPLIPFCLFRTPQTPCPSPGGDSDKRLAYIGSLRFAA